MAERKQQDPRPPEPPEITRRVRLTRPQWAALPVLLGVPILAAFGLFGETRARAEVSGGPLEVAVDYPTRLRYKQVESLALRIRNAGGQPMDTVTVAFDTAYVAAFSNVTFLPQASRPYEVELTNVPPGETALVVAQLQARRYGGHRGTITVGAAGDRVELAVSSTTFP